MVLVQCWVLTVSSIAEGSLASATWDTHFIDPVRMKVGKLTCGSIWWGVYCHRTILSAPGFQGRMRHEDDHPTTSQQPPSPNWKLIQIWITWRKSLFFSKWSRDSRFEGWSLDQSRFYNLSIVFSIVLLRNVSWLSNHQKLGLFWQLCEEEDKHNFEVQFKPASS